MSTVSSFRREERRISVFFVLTFRRVGSERGLHELVVVGLEYLANLLECVGLGMKLRSNKFDQFEETFVESLLKLERLLDLTPVDSVLLGQNLEKRIEISSTFFQKQILNMPEFSPGRRDDIRRLSC